MHTKKQNEQNPKVEISIGYPQEVYKNKDLKKNKPCNYLPKQEIPENENSRELKSIEVV